MLASLFEWQTLIFLIPLCVASLLLILYAIRPHHSGHSMPTNSHHMISTSHTTQSHGHLFNGHHASRISNTSKSSAELKQEGSNTKVSDRVTYSASLSRILCLDKIPVLVLFESFCVAWGAGGLLANEYLTPHDKHVPIFFSIITGFLTGTAGALVSAQILSRILPEDETLAVNRDNLYGSTGEVAYTVTGQSGRILIYDEHGTLHDELCRLAPGHEPIKKGKRARITDIEPGGIFIVEPDTTS